tara:strand:- start:1226 stop:1639 length:414 start_codon:yes stop_codon:yes gene_type:complete
MTDEFEKGDLVVYAGLTKKLSGDSAAHYRLGIVNEVGKYELFIKEQGSHLGLAFRVAKECAMKVDRTKVKPIPVNDYNPKLGDLVLSLNDSKYTKIQKDHGILIEISEVPGQLKSGKIRKGTNEKLVTYGNLIVLEH